MAAGSKRASIEKGRNGPLADGTTTKAHLGDSFAVHKLFFSIYASVAVVKCGWVLPGEEGVTSTTSDLTFY